MQKQHADHTEQPDDRGKQKIFHGKPHVEKTATVWARGASGALTQVKDGQKFPVTAQGVLERLAGAPLPDWQAVAGAITERLLQPGDALFLAGEKKPCVFVVGAGVVRMDYETPNGDTWVKGFAEPGVCFASLSALDENGRTSFAARALVASTIQQIDYRVVRSLAETHLAWQRALTTAFRIYGQRKEQREMALLTLSPEERYQQFMRECPQLAAMLRQRDIASYIRVTPVALSRIKARLSRYP